VRHPFNFSSCNGIASSGQGLRPKLIDRRCILNKTILIMLDQRARTYDEEARLASDKFNKGFFEGKAEQARQAIVAIQCLANNDTEGAVDALNGNI